MMFAMGGLLVAAVLFAAMVALQDVGRRLGERERRLSPDHESGASSVAEGAVFALLGLFLTLTFSGGASRFDARRQLIVDGNHPLGSINKFYDPPTYSAGAHSDLVSAADFTLQYTINASEIPPVILQ